MVSKIKKNKKRESRQNIFFSIFIGGGLLLVVAFLLHTNWKVYQRRIEFAAKIANLKQEIAFLEQRKKEFEEKKSQTKSKEYLEEVAREELGLKKPGEEVVVVQEEKPEQKKEIEEKKSWWERIKSFLRRD